jgi:predicted phage terminase large subunit-like protein
MTRWSDEDLAGYLLKGTKAKKQLKQWRVISIPAILDKESAELLNKPVGGSYWPEFWPLERLMELKEDPSMSTTKWNALYMQNPVPAEGNLVKLDWCKLWTDAERERQQIPRGMSPNLEYIVISLDTAFSEKDAADYSAYTVWGVFNRTVESFTGKYMKIPSLFLLAADKGRWSFPDLCKKVQGIYDFYKPDGIIIEKKASGQSLIQEMRRRGLPIIEFSPDTDKLTRVYACTPLFENGRIWFPDEDWALDVISDLIKFPNVVKKDIVDTCSQAILWMRDTWHVNSTEDEPEDEDDKFRLRKRTYWGALVKA